MIQNELSNEALEGVVGGQDTTEKKECTTTRKKLKDGRVIETTVCVIEPNGKASRETLSPAPVID